MYLHILSDPVMNIALTAPRFVSYTCIYICNSSQENAIMTIRITQSLSRALPVATAMLFLQFGSAAAASPQGDIQEQMREILSGSVATHTIHPSESRRDSEGWIVWVAT